MSVNVARYSKAIAAGCAAVAAAVADNVFDMNDAWQVATAVLAAVGVVWAAPPNK